MTPVSVPPHMRPPCEQYEARQALNELLVAIQKLPADQAQVFNLLAQGLSQREVAEQLNISEVVVRKRISRGRMALRKQLEKGHPHA